MVDDFGKARKAENTDPRMNYAVRYATARGRLTLNDWKRGKGPHLHTSSLTKKTTRFTKGRFRPY